MSLLLTSRGGISINLASMMAMIAVKLGHVLGHILCLDKWTPQWCNRSETLSLSAGLSVAVQFQWDLDLQVLKK